MPNNLRHSRVIKINDCDSTGVVMRMDMPSEAKGEMRSRAETN